MLIIPKNHIDNFQQSPGEMFGDMSGFIQEVAIVTGVDKSGYRLITNCGENGGQEVMHLHFHLLGGKKLPWAQNLSKDPKTSF